VFFKPEKPRIFSKPFSSRPLHAHIRHLTCFCRTGSR